MPVRPPFRNINQVSELLGEPPHVLRFWETKFTQVRPVKRAGGRRYYRAEDVAILAGISKLTRELGYTLRGVQRVIKEQGAQTVIDVAGAQGRRGNVKQELALRSIAEDLPVPGDGLPTTNHLAQLHDAAKTLREIADRLRS